MMPPPTITTPARAGTVGSERTNSTGGDIVRMAYDSMTALTAQNARGDLRQPLIVLNVVVGSSRETQPDGVRNYMRRRIRSRFQQAGTQFLRSLGRCVARQW